MKKDVIEELVVSDIHLGSSYCKPGSIRKLFRALRRYHFKRLVILGDLSEGEKPIGLWQNALVRYLHKIRHKVILVSGNHDCQENAISRAIGIKPVESYEVERNGKKILLIHGHQFDDLHTTFEGKTSDKLICDLIAFVMMVELFGLKIGKVILNLFMFFATLSVIRKIKEFAKKNHYHTIICGHTHVPLKTTLRVKPRRLVDHVNSGHWLHEQGTFVTIDVHCTVELQEAA